MQRIASLKWGSNARLAPSSEWGESKDDDREQKQETESEASDCEQAVRVNSVGEHGFPGLPTWATAAAVRYQRNHAVQVPRRLALGPR